MQLTGPPRVCEPAVAMNVADGAAEKAAAAAAHHAVTAGRVLSPDQKRKRREQPLPMPPMLLPALSPILRSGAAWV